MNGEATGPAKTAGAAVPVIIEKRWKTYTPSRVDASCDLISLYGLKPLYQAFVRPSTSSKPGLASDVKPSTEEGSSGLGRRVQLPPGIGALLAEQSNIPGKSYMEKPSLLPLHEACPPHLLDPSFRMMPFENFESLRDAMRLMPGRTDVNKKPKKRAGSPGEVSRSKKRKELEKRRAENQRLNMQTAPASLQRASQTTAGPRSPFHPGQGRSSSRPASPMPIGAGSPAGSVGSPGPAGEAPKIKLKLNFGGSPKP